MSYMTPQMAAASSLASANELNMQKFAASRDVSRALSGARREMSNLHRKRKVTCAQGKLWNSKQTQLH